MRCIDKICKHRKLNGGDDISDFYFCEICGISVDRGENECLFDKWDNEFVSQDKIGTSRLYGDGTGERIVPPDVQISYGLFDPRHTEKSYPLPGDKYGLSYDYWG